ncbi:hypothetical protein [Nonomuraea sp. NPDC049709]|uniref:hypothetical protein n=1 Tax=Nonomuraea sp. NPDC049709 TaxID=3154736 RepID=UPI00341459AC
MSSAAVAKESRLSKEEVVSKTTEHSLFVDRTPDGAQVTGIVGRRQLVAVQTFDIARLTTHPVPIVPGAFVAVSGEGPKGDSNGSGKTTFLSAVSLLLGDPQWRLDVDGRHAVELLFQPGAAGLDVSAGGANHGYIVGVFAGESPFRSTDLITVWVRISRTPAFVKMRWTRGLHVAEGGTDQERQDQANELWNDLPRNSETGSRTMAETLFGDAPRCLAYLDTTVRPSVPSLLSQQMTAMSPERIGEALIALTGRDHLLAAESRLRREHAAQSDELDTRRQEDARDRINEDLQLEALKRREAARAEVAEAVAAWEAHLAQGVLERVELHATKGADVEAAEALIKTTKNAVEQQRNELRALEGRTDLQYAVTAAERARSSVDGERVNLDKKIGRLEERLGGLLTKRSKLSADAESDDGLAIDLHEELVEAAELQLTVTKIDLNEAEKEYQQLLYHLEAVEQGYDGPAGEALALLHGANLQAVSLIDAITLDPAARAVWEPRLWSYRDAVVITRDDESAVLDLLSSLAGATVVLADGPLEDQSARPLPPGIASTAPISGFLEALEDRYEHRTVPDRAHDLDLDTATLGGFPEPFTGRSVRVARAREDAERAEQEVNARQGAVETAKITLRHEQRQLAAAQAAAELSEVRALLKELETNISEARGERGDAEQRWKVADEAHSGAKSALDNHDDRIARLRNDLIAQERKLGEAIRDHRKEAEALSGIGLQEWRIAWSNTDEAAENLITKEANKGHRHTSVRWRDLTIRHLHQALTHVTRDPDQASPALQQLKQDADNSTHPLEKDDPDRAFFATLVQPLHDLLDAKEEHDQALRDRIHRNRFERAVVIAETSAELDRLHGDLDLQQGMVERSIELALRAISAQLDQLDQDREGGYGARLEIDIIRPESPDDNWTWNVTPKWRRSPAGSFVSYREVANGAQVKVFAIQLVLAALLADDHVPGRLLILDELGNSLGDANRKDVLSALNRVAHQQGVTILGTCQDSVVYDAAEVCGEVLWFSHATATEPYNRPTRAWGHDPEQGRVELVAFWLRTGR